MKNVFLCTAKFLIFVSFRKEHEKQRIHFYRNKNSILSKNETIKKLGKISISYSQKICKAFFKAFFYAMKKSASHGNFSVV